MFDDDDDDVFEFSGPNRILDEHGGDYDIWEPPRGLSKEDYSEIYEKVHPTASQWKDGSDSRNDDVFVTVDEGSRVMWNQAKVEITFVKEKLKSILGTDSPKIIDLFNLIFGCRSRLGRLLEEKLEVSSEELSKRLGLFFLSSAYNLSKTKIFSKHSMVDKDGLVSEEEYQDFWNAIAVSGVKTGKAGELLGHAARTRGAKPLWIEIEAALNDTCRELFIEGFESFLRIIIDDDKMHDASKRQDMYGLKKTQHVRDNRTGCILHTLVYTAIGLPIGAQWERSSDDSTTAATERLIRSQFVPMHGDMGPPNLTNSLFAMDRGYLLPRLFYDFLIPSGAEVMGTIKRCPMFPFTFDQDLKSSDPRQDIPTKGQKALFLKNLKVCNKKVAGYAYRDGKGSVTLGINTCIRHRDWDLVVCDPKDAERYQMPISEQESEPVKWYHAVSEENTSSSFDELFSELNIKPLTLKQATPEWFLLRMLSCTSSSTDRLLIELKKIVSSNASLIDCNVLGALYNVLNAVHGTGWNRRYACYILMNCVIFIKYFEKQNVVFLFINFICLHINQYRNTSNQQEETGQAVDLPIVCPAEDIAAATMMPEQPPGGTELNDIPPALVPPPIRNAVTMTMPEQPTGDTELNGIPPATFAPSFAHNAVATTPEQPTGDTVLNDTALPGSFALFTTRNSVNCEDSIDHFFCLLTASDATTAADAARELSRRIASGALNDLALKAYLEKGGMKPFATRQANLSLLKKWVDESPQRRPYFLLNKAQLIAACVAKFGGSQSSYQKEGKEELIQRLALRHFQAPNGRTNPTQSAGIRSNASGIATGDSLHTSLLKKIVEASFMPRLTAKGKEFCKSGHQLEGPFGEKLLKHSKEGITKFRVKQLFRVGLVGKSDAIYAKASTDFIGLAIIDGVQTLVAVECKGCLTPATSQAEREHAEDLTRGTNRADADCASWCTHDLYTVIEASSSDFHTYVDSTHEAVQLLHTAYVYSFAYVLLLVGDSSGTIIRGKLKIMQ